jgi:hypothetical protein
VSTESQNFENHRPFNADDGKAIPILEHHAVKEYGGSTLAPGTAEWSSSHSGHMIPTKRAPIIHPPCERLGDAESLLPTKNCGNNLIIVTV